MAQRSLPFRTRGYAWTRPTSMWRSSKNQGHDLTPAHAMAGVPLGTWDYCRIGIQFGRAR